MPEQTNIFLQARHFTEIPPLNLHFHKDEVDLSDNNRVMIQQWVQKINKDKIQKYNIPIFINSYASAPTGLRDYTNDTARHEALRIAINRGLRAKSFLEDCGIDQSHLILRAPGPGRLNSDAKLNDGITITTRQN